MLVLSRVSVADHSLATWKNGRLLIATNLLLAMLITTLFRIRSLTMRRARRGVLQHSEDPPHQETQTASNIMRTTMTSCTSTTRRPTSARTAQQLIEAFPDDPAQRWLLRDSRHHLR